MAQRLTAEEALELFYSLPDDVDHSTDSEEDDDVDEAPAVFTRSKDADGDSVAACLSPSDADSSSENAEGDESDDDGWGTRSLPHEKSIPEFCSKPPASSKLPANFTPLMIFDALFGDAVDILVDQTNLFAKQEKIKGWQDTTNEEMRAFLGMMIKMGFHKLENRRDYWCTDSDLAVPSINSIMPRSRFFLLLRALHANDNTTAKPKHDPEHDPLHKIRLVMTSLTSKFGECYEPSTYHSVDESMVRFKGKKSFKQYMPMKPIKRGFKVWVRADATTGFIMQFDVYTGKESNGSRLGTRVVEKFTEELANTFVRRRSCSKTSSTKTFMLSPRSGSTGKVFLRF